ncbi:MAG: M20/M25/M40 family metallo-hydrolase [Propionibacteriaceae bacterium]|jgi:carboxypeptidase PM20D1|nr:M20/M25/M40 family metallo-hydrolase [Propionibacteriaceae bacterium]
MTSNAAEHLSQLVQIPTVSATIETSGMEPFDTLIDKLKELYPALHERLTCEKVTPLGLLYRWEGTDPSLAKEPVVLMAHFDVVPVDLNDPWTHPPFAGVIEDGKVYGRGTLDDKGALVVLLEAVESLVSEGYTPQRDTYLSLGGNEESYGDAAVAIAQTLKERNIVPSFVLDEGGAVVDAPLPFVKVRAAMIGVGEKGIATITLTAPGEAGHASAPKRFTAISRVARAVARLTPSTFPAHLSASTVSMLASFIPHTEGPAAVALKALVAAPAVTAQTFAKMGGEPAALVHTTVAATLIEGGTADNVLPSSAKATLNVRIATGETVESTVARIKRKIADSKVSVEVAEGSGPSAESPTTGPAWDALVAAVRESYPDAVASPYVMMAATDSRHFHKYAPRVYRFAPLAMNAAQRATVHGVDEWVEIDSLERGTVFYRSLITALTAPTD